MSNVDGRIYGNSFLEEFQYGPFVLDANPSKFIGGMIYDPSDMFRVEDESPEYETLITRLIGGAVRSSVSGDDYVGLSVYSNANTKVDKSLSDFGGKIDTTNYNDDFADFDGDDISDDNISNDDIVNNNKDDVVNNMNFLGGDGASVSLELDDMVDSFEGGFEDSEDSDDKEDMSMLLSSVDEGTEFVGGNHIFSDGENDYGELDEDSDGFDLGIISVSGDDAESSDDA